MAFTIRERQMGHLGQESGYIDTHRYGIVGKRTEGGWGNFKVARHQVALITHEGG